MKPQRQIDELLHVVVDLLEEASSLAKPDNRLLETIDQLAECVSLVPDLLAIEYLTCSEVVALVASDHDSVSLAAVRLLDRLVTRLVCHLGDVLRRPERFLELLDELVYRLSTAADPTVARSIVTLLLLIMSCDEEVLEFFCHKYGGIRPLLKRWQGRGFDLQLRKFGDAVSSGDLQLAEAEHRRRAATLIQARFRGFLSRRRLVAATATIARLQRRIRARQAVSAQQRVRRAEAEQADFRSRLGRQQRRREHRERVLRSVAQTSAESVPAYLGERRRTAAICIQRAWRRFCLLRHLPERLQHRRRHRAAVVIQRWWRHCRIRMKADEDGGGVLLITEHETKLYQQKIDGWLDAALAPGSRQYTAAELRAQLAESQRLLARLSAQLARDAAHRRRCRSLLAQTQAISEQLSGAPGQRPPDHYWCPSRRLATRARVLHRRALAHAAAPWWQKLEPFDDGYN